MKLPWYLKEVKEEKTKDGFFNIIIEPHWLWLKWIQIKIIYRWFFTGKIK